MAIQFLDVSGAKKVLFAGSSIAMDPACCCDEEPSPLTQCCSGGYPDAFEVTFDGWVDGQADNCDTLNGNFIVPYDSFPSYSFYFLKIDDALFDTYIEIIVECDLENRVINVQVGGKCAADPVHTHAYYETSIPISDDGNASCSDYFTDLEVPFSFVNYWPASNHPCSAWPTGSITINGVYD